MSNINPWADGIKPNGADITYINTNSCDMYNKNTLNILCRGTDNYGWTNTTYARKKSFQLPPGIYLQGKIRISYQLVQQGEAVLVYSKAYRNGSPIGAEYSTNTTQFIIDDVGDAVIRWLPGDTIEIWGKVANSSGIGAINDPRVHGIFVSGFLDIS